MSSEGVREIKYGVLKTVSYLTVPVSSNGFSCVFAHFSIRGCQSVEVWSSEQNRITVRGSSLGNDGGVELDQKELG